MYEQINTSANNNLHDQRNNIYWIISDTLYQVKGTDAVIRDTILCENLRLICNAKISFMFFFNAENNELSFNSVSFQNESQKFDLKSILRRFVITDKQEFVRIRNKNIDYSKNFNVFDFFSVFITPEIKTELIEVTTDLKGYNISTVRKNDNILIGAVYIDSAERLRHIDLIGNYINMAAIIINDDMNLNALKISNYKLNTAKCNLEKQKNTLQDQATQLNEMNLKLKELNSMKDKFFSIIAHDLRNPFNHILGFSEILANRFNELPEDKKIKYTELIHSTAKNTYTLLENLLLWSRSQRNKIEPKPKKLDISILIKKNFELLAEGCMSKKIILENTANEMNYAFADENMIDTIVRNLITNAMKFTPEGGKIKAICYKNNQGIVTQIEDSGIGMSEEETSKLFKIDGSFSKSGTNGEAGTGLGLILCKEFIDKNGGKIWVESIKGKGSKFCFLLPVYP